MNRWPFELAHQMALFPLIWLTVLDWRGHSRDRAWWWLSGIFLVSWLSDTVADLVPELRLVASVVYPLSQAAIAALVFLARREALLILVALAAIALAAVVWRGVSSPDVLFRTVAWGAAVGIVYNRPIGRLRIALLATFGIALLWWWAYVLEPGWWTWGAYQVARAAGIGLFCWASLKPGPTLRRV